MNEGKVRKDFEYWAVNKRDYSVERFESAPRQYVEQNTHVAWTAWRDSRTHLVVELPVFEFFDPLSGETLNVIHCEDMKEALESQGIKWK